jgi:peptide/nickel transport system ATP-binding protein
MKDVAVEVADLVKHFPLKLGFFASLRVKNPPAVRAVDGVSFNIMENEVFGLVGESGCGKTTTGRCILRLVEPTGGKITFKETDVTGLSPQQMRRMRRRMQIVFQDPYESLNPRMSTYDILAEPLQLQQATGSPEEVDEKVAQILEDMGLVPPEEFMYRFPHELSGGQRQRVAIGRAFILDPEFIVADEPVSMLDASIRSEVVKLMQTMVANRGITFLYITHDLALTRYLCNRIAVMYLGKVVEVGPSEEIIDKPHHPYAEALIAAVPVPDPTLKRTKILIKGEVPSPVNPPSGCRFHPRCPYSKDKCRQEEPMLVNSGKNRVAACHFPLS